ncbi:hypothetical protein AK88_01938 [Plasmodium fragile]|uniref:Schizont-infected cell agglutination extracellular alpha domain-containing protein n=1 Tax=Plasmodium fragile TaxID=5857 RepID=A0A0D9QNE4_PLAFR|nr:uncharacterized protein AK88_01938 [Plasmodium fragile]KJP88322.1 hypothetical protein AK88_01938 [Plasmodium fragile]
MNVFLFMDRIDWVGEKWAQSRIFKHEQVLEDYLRCMLGNVAIVEHFGKHCMHIEIVKAVSTAMSMWRESFQDVDNSKKCEHINYNDLKVGSKLVGLTMAKWMEELRDAGRISPGTASATGGVCRGSKGKTGERRADSGQGSVPVAGVLNSQDQEELKTFINKGKDLTEQDRKDLLKEVFEQGGGLQGIENILDKVKEGEWPRDNKRTKNSQTGNTGNARGTAKTADGSKPADNEAATPPGESIGNTDGRKHE